MTKVYIVANVTESPSSDDNDSPEIWKSQGIIMSAVMT